MDNRTTLCKGTSNCPWVCNAGYLKTGATCSVCASLPVGVVYTGPGVSSIWDAPWCCTTGYYQASGVYSSGYTTSGSSCLQCTNSTGVGTTLILGGGNCGVYTGTGTVGNDPPVTCNPGAYKSGNTCLPCSIGPYSPGGSTTTCQACTNAITGPGAYVSSGSSVSRCTWACGEGATLEGAACVPTTCAPGVFRSAGVCTTCPNGTYSAGGNAAACTTCRECCVGANKSTLCPPGSATDVSTCACNPGYWRDGAACSACPTGTYSNTVGVTSYPCLQCPAGTLNNRTGGSAVTWCLPCRPGWFGATNGSSVG